MHVYFPREEVTKSLFKEYSPCKLESDVVSINAMIDNLPDQVFELIEVEKAREIDMEHKVSLDIESESYDGQSIPEEISDDIPLDVIGQIFLRKRLSIFWAK